MVVILAPAEDMTSDLTPPPAGACSFAESEKDTYITQIIHRLEALHMSTLVNTQQAYLPASTFHAKEQEPTICCSQTKSCEALKQHNTTHLRMLTHRWHNLGLQPPILWSTQEHPKSVETSPALDISRITLIESSVDETKTISSSLCGSSDTCNCAPVKANVTEQCSLNNSSQESVECEDSDLSDLEKDNIPISDWAAPVKLDLRPDLCDGDQELSEMTEEEQVYPAVLPYAELESQHLRDPCLTAMVARMLELEKLQAATIHREQIKAVRSRPATALVQSAHRLRRGESPCYQIENFRTKGNNSVLADLTKLNLPSSSRSHSRQRIRPLSHSAKMLNALQKPHTLHKKPNTSAVKLRNTVASAHIIAARSNLSPKCNRPIGCMTHKHLKNNMPKKTPEKTSVYSESPCSET